MNLFAISGILIGISSSGMAVLMFAAAKQKLHYIWSFFCLAVAIWGWGAYKIATTSDPNLADFWWRVTHIGVIFIPVLFVHFIFEFLQQRGKPFIKFVYILGIIFLVADFWGTLFIANMRWVFGQFYYDSPPGILYIPFTFFFLGLVIYSHILLWNARTRETGLRRTQIQYFLTGMVVSFAGGSLSFLPVYGIDFYPIFNVAAFLYTPILTYAILRKQLFEVKILLVQLLVGAISILLFFNAFTSETNLEYAWKGILFLFFLTAGYLLIRSVMSEIEAREEIETLAKDLQIANAELARVSQAKSDFLSIASHQLKTPLSIIKGYLSLITESSFGHITKKLKDPLQRIYISNERLISLVEDLLNLSRIEDGRMKYDMEKANIVDIITSVHDEFKDQAKQRNLKLIWTPSKEKLLANVDKVKIRNVVFNLVDNAIKYTEHGSITLTLTKEGREAVLRVVDTGIGIEPDHLNRLFAKFTRLEDGNRNFAISGFGLGLYITKLIVRDHKGRIWVESDGLGRGSTFLLALPLL